MSKNGSEIEIRPLSVAIRGDQGTIALFSCEMPAALDGKARVWATCGQRKRLPIPASIERDATDAAVATRKLLLRATLPQFYTACTIHLIVRDGRKARFASCRIPHERFRPLSTIVAHPETDERYNDWFLAHRADADELASQRERAGRFTIKPLISIVTPIYRTPRLFLRDLVESLLAQTYGRFELVLVNVSGECPEVDETLAEFDDERIRVVAAPNKTIPENTNAGIAAARGDYVGFVDHDDFIEPDLLFRYVEAINEHPECDLLFCDEDLWGEYDGDGSTGGERPYCGARFKPGWNYDLVCSHNYVCHLLMVSRWALERTERSQADVNGAQDYDLTLKVAEVARDISHVEGVLYHWRRHPSSTASNHKSKPYALEAGRLAVQRHFDRIGVDAEVAAGTAPFSYRTRYRAARPASISIVLFDRASNAAAREAGEARALGGRVELVSCGATALNDAVALARGERIVVLDNAVEARGGAWLAELANQLERADIGCSTPLLAGPDGFVRSAGLMLGGDRAWRHRFAGYPAHDMGYMLMLEYAHDVLAAPMRCLAFRKADHERAGGFDEALPPDWAAVDFCLRLREMGLLTVLDPYEPMTVADETADDPDAFAPLADGAFADLLAERHPALADGDPYLDSLLDQRSGNYQLSGHDG